jgi:hypothetical protein
VFYLFYLDYNLSGFHKNQGRKKNRIDKSKDKRTNMHLFRKKKKKIVDNKTTIIYHHMSSHKEKDTIVYPRTWPLDGVEHPTKTLRTTPIRWHVNNTR